MNKEEEKNCCCCSIIDYLGNIWENYKHHSSKIAIIAAILGVTAAILVDYDVFASSVMIGVTNVSVFFSGIAFEKLRRESDYNIEELKSENRRLTVISEAARSEFKFPLSTNQNDDTISLSDPPKIMIDTSPYIEPIIEFNKIHLHTNCPFS